MARSTYMRAAVLAAFAFVSVLAGCDSTTATDLESVLRDSKAPAVKVAKITLAPSPLNLSVGDSAQVAVTLLDASGDSIRNRTAKWSSYDLTVATVSADGKIAALKTGYSIIYAKLDGVTGWVMVTVAAGQKSDKAKPGAEIVSSLTVSPAALEMSESDQAIQLSATAKDGAGKALGSFALKWTTSDSSIVRVDTAGRVIPVGAGSAHVIASAGQKADTAHVVVKARPVPPASLKITPDGASLSIGEAVQFEARLSGSKASLNCTLSWKSISPAVASVNADGRVVGHGVGTAKIVASCGTAADTVSATVHDAQQGGLAAIDATGHTDVTEKLNAYFASVPDGSTIRFPRNAKYRVDHTLLIKNRHNLVIEGNGAVFSTTVTGPFGWKNEQLLQVDKRNRTRSHWSVVNSSGITFRNLTVHGANPYAGLDDRAYNADYEAQHGFNLLGAVDILIEDVTVTDVWGDFVYLGMSGDGAWSRNVVIRDNRFERNGRQGIAITGARDVVIERNTIKGVRRSHLDVEPNTTDGGAVNIRVANNTFGPNRLKFLASGGRGGRVDGIIIENNRLFGAPLNIQMIPPTGSRRSHIKIIDNVSDKSFGSPESIMRFVRVDGLEVRGNVNPLDKIRQMTAVVVNESCAVVVSGNSFVGARAESSIESHTCK